MELQHVNVKVFIDGELNVDLEEIIKVFHRWTAEQSMDELLIDIADYRHVPAGPGVVLVGHDADYGIDYAGNRCGLLYNRKASVDGSNVDRIKQAVQAASKACGLLEAEFSTLKFNRTELDITINDRAIAPNTAETLTTLTPDIEAAFDGPVTIEHDDDSRRRFGVRVKLAEPLAIGA